MSEIAAAAVGYTAGEQETGEVLAWFERYDALVAAGDFEAMADLAAFPLNEVTDNTDGHGVAGPCDRERFVAQMRDVVGGAGEVTMESTRHPVFLSSALVFVVTDAAFTAEGQTHRMRYGDLLVKTDTGWRFQTMVAGGFRAQM